MEKIFQASASWLLMRTLLLIAVPLTCAASDLRHTSPSFDCKKAKDDSVEKLICSHDELAALDREMAVAYQDSLNQLPARRRRELIDSQIHWLKIRRGFESNSRSVDPDGEISDFVAFYQKRISALRSLKFNSFWEDMPKESQWLRKILPDPPSYGRALLSCDDPCQIEPFVYKVISFSGNGEGEPPGDIVSPLAKIEKKLLSERWLKCRESTDSSGASSTDYFKKDDKILAVSTHFSMGTGNGIGVNLTSSSPQPQKPAVMAENPIAPITNDWNTYSISGVAGVFEIQLPPQWSMRSVNFDHLPNTYFYNPKGPTKEILPTESKTFAFTPPPSNFKLREFNITIEPGVMAHYEPPFPSNEPKRICIDSKYKIAGFSAKECRAAEESDFILSCNRWLDWIIADIGDASLTVHFDSSASLGVGTNPYRLRDVYEKILSTLRMKK
jgi:uncharacterized protein YecT (DUF1311 family)